ncbi:MAG: glycosyltransferase family 39 protein, partial [Clostridia bacterium]|nr:glycosyltransferase family 39 protein [Deltaproteobacteria bacterium]
MLTLVAIGAIIYLPYLGGYPLWDPWEPHYLQVAWEMRDHHTWLNPFYRNEDNWWSKPILLLWLLRVGIIFWDSVQHFGDHELWARLPFALVAIAGGVLQFDWVRRLYGRTAGFIAALALITAPQYVVIGRQVMIDVTFVLAYAASLGYLAVGLFTPRPELAAADAPLTSRVLAWLAREGPFAAFWSLEAIALLGKGFVAQTLVVLVIAGYAIATFRWQDYAMEWRRAWGKKYAFKRSGLGVIVIGCAIAASVVLPSQLGKDQRHLYQTIIFGAALLVLLLVVFREFPLAQHVANILARIRIGWGLPLFLAIGAPWYVYMTVNHGWPYWNEFIFYHHLGRAAGTIDKPGNTFDYFIRQLAYATFPWSAFALPAFWQIVTRASPFRSVAERRNFFLLIGILLPFMFFGLSGTKFAHYIFPVVPFMCAAIAVGLVWLGKDSGELILLGETGPPIGPTVPALTAGADYESPWWQRVGARGDMIV